MFAKILDIKTYETCWAKGNEYFWQKGNGACDCNRRLEFNKLRKLSNKKIDDCDDCEANRYYILEIKENPKDITTIKGDLSYCKDTFIKYNQYYTLSEQIRKLVKIKRNKNLTELLK